MTDNKHDFKKALNWLHDVEGSIHESCQYKETIEFALRLAARLQSGEVSDRVCKEGIETFWGKGLGLNSTFVSMTNELMKEVEDE